MFERPRSGERVVLVHLTLGDFENSRELLEFQHLVASAGAVRVAIVSGTRSAPESRYFVGTGKAQEIREVVTRQGAELVIFNHDLSSSQERNLEALLGCRVLDRSGLILDIFAQRARSFEGKLQVELAQLRHLSTRLVRGWTHLERQKGGIGLRGPGETQLETDRRLLGQRIQRINKRLAKVDRQRNQGRQSRRKVDVPTVSLVGYTNAGKSTLFNRLVGADVHAADQLFATLDPTLRRLPLPDADPAVLVDTVGFISRLPHELIAAFRSTLQETCEASLLLHVIDASDPAHAELAENVEAILAQIGADQIPCIRVYNKVDCLDEQPRPEREASEHSRSVRVSAASGTGLDALRDAVAKRLRGEIVRGWVCLPPQEIGRFRARLFSMGAVVKERLNPDGQLLIEVQTSRRNLRQLCRREGFREEWMRQAS